MCSKGSDITLTNRSTSPAVPITRYGKRISGEAPCKAPPNKALAHFMEHKLRWLFRILHSSGSAVRHTSSRRHISSPGARVPCIGPSFVTFLFSSCVLCRRHVFFCQEAALNNPFLLHTPSAVQQGQGILCNAKVTSIVLLPIISEHRTVYVSYKPKSGGLQANKRVVLQKSFLLRQNVI